MVYLKGVFVSSTILLIISIVLISLSNTGYAKIAYKKPIYNKSNLMKEKRYKIKQDTLKITTTTTPQMDECRTSEVATILNDEQQPKINNFNDYQQETKLSSTSQSLLPLTLSSTSTVNNNSPLDINKPKLLTADLIEDTEIPVFSTFNNNDVDITHNNNANNNNNNNVDNNDVNNKQLKKLHEIKSTSINTAATTTASPTATTTTSPSLSSLSSLSSSSTSSSSSSSTTTTTTTTESNLPVPCTCGIFLTSQLRLGHPIEKPIITNELERTYSCNVIGQKQCQTKCLETIVQHLPNSANIICATLNRDCRKERAYLYIKNCKNHWINTTLTAGRDYCCKDGQPFTCPLI